LTFLGAVDPVETNLFGSAIVQDFEGVAVDYPDYSSGEVGERRIGEKKNDKTCQK
jgi:hypothetical protein